MESCCSPSLHNCQVGDKFSLDPHLTFSSIQGHIGILQYTSGPLLRTVKVHHIRLRSRERTGHSSCLFFIKPVFNEMLGCLCMEQIPLFNILKKFDGEMVTEVVRPQLARMRYEITRLPHYMILHMRRFTKNNFFVEKNPTLGEHSCCGLQCADMLIVDLVFCLFSSVYTTPTFENRTL